MKLRSSRVLKTGRHGVVLGLGNIKSPLAKWLRSPVTKVANEAERLSLSSNRSNSCKKGANEAEIGICVDNPDEDLEMATVFSEGIKDGLITDDKGLFLGSEVLDPIKDLPVSCPDGEIEEESVECKETNKSSTTETEKLVDDTKIVNGDVGMDIIIPKKGRGRPRKNKKIININKNQTESVNVEGGENVIVKRKRGRKRKNIENSECNDDKRAKKKKIGVRVSERVLRLKNMAVSGGGVVVDGGKPEKKVERRGRPRKIHCETNEIPKKPLKKQSKLQSGNIKKKETRGRPRKIQVNEIVPQKKIQKDIIIKKLKMRKVKLMGIKNSKRKRSKGNKGKESEDDISEGIGRGDRIKVVRDKLLDILVRAGWSFDRRPRLARTYQDFVYIEPSGRSHWSITKAYNMLTKKVKNGNADSNEISAFIQIPQEEIGMLFRHVDKELGYKKKKNQIWKVGKKIKKIVPTKKKKKDSKHKKGIIVKTRKARLLARDEKGTKHGKNGRLVYIKKRNLLSWMIDTGVISSGSKVEYKTRRKKMVFNGTITNNGIICSCCNETMSVSDFVIHSGGKLNHGFDSLHLESGVSFRKCLFDSWKKEEELNRIKFNIVDVEGNDPNDDTCNICGDGGNLICCDTCPSTFHQTCLDIQNFPPGDWNCIYCSCKFCGVVSVIAPEKPTEMLSCSLCEEKFHESCLTEVGPVGRESNRLSFCGKKCHELFERLQKYIGVKNKLEDGFSWTLLQRSEINQDLSIFKTKSKVENNSKLAVAYSVMDECFLPIFDERSGTTIIRNVVYNCGSNFQRLNYAGFLTAILEKGDELITTASIRLHGSRLAEMPFIGTRHMYRRQGMCRRLLDAIESTLSSIGVEELIIPAIPALLQTWTKVFGFFPIEELKKQEMKSINMMVFPGISMLQKPLFHTDKSLTETTPRDAINCNEIPMDEVEITENAIEYEKLETTSSNGIDYEEKIVVEKDVVLVHYEQMEEDNNNNIILMDDDSCHEEDKLINSNGVDSLYDLNFPVKNVTESVICGPHQSSESELRVENGDSVVVNGSPLTSELVTKNTFDLNLQPTVVDSDMQIVG